MEKIKREDLWGLEEYARRRNDFRMRVMAHKKQRTVHIGEHMILHFEDRLLMHYQIQEMLRIERIFEVVGIEEEIKAYNPLIPDGSNWKATMMIQYGNAAVRQEKLRHLVGVDEQTWGRVGEHKKVYAISDEDMDRKTDEKTSAVHFLRFELSAAMVADAKAGADIAFGCDHENYKFMTVLDDVARVSLCADLN